MKSWFWLAIILAILAVASLLTFTSEGGPRDGSGTPEELEQAVLNPEEENITNYDECLAAGNSPLPDAPDKCLTKSGHLFIEGVVE